MSSFPLPLRPAVASQQQQEREAQEQDQDQDQQPGQEQQDIRPTQISAAAESKSSSPQVNEDDLPPPSPSPAAVGNVIENVAKWVDTTPALQTEENHRFWVNDSSIAENLFTIHRSTRHLFDFTSSLIGNDDSVLGLRPIPVMSDGDILFMSQLSSDISRSVGSISAIRHHSQRTARKRKTRPEVVPHRVDGIKRLQSGSRPVPTSHIHPHPHRAGPVAASSSGPELAVIDDETEGSMICFKCGRTDTPEWRRGGDGEVLCNACGLVYAKQKRKGKGKATNQSPTGPL